MNRAETIAAYRADHPEYRERGRKQVKARWRALTELTRRHRAEFDRLYAAELAKLGVEPRRLGRPPRRDEVPS